MLIGDGVGTAVLAAGRAGPAVLAAGRAGAASGAGTVVAAGDKEAADGAGVAVVSSSRRRHRCVTFSRSNSCKNRRDGNSRAKNGEGKI